MTAKNTPWIKALIPLCIILLALGIFYALKISKPQAPSKKIEEKVWSVKTVSAELKAQQPHLVLYGKVATPRMTNITAAVTAFVATVDTDAGKNISKHAPLIALDDSDIKLQIAQRQADVNQFKAQIAAEKTRHDTDSKSLVIEKKLQQLSLKAVTRYKNLIKRKVSSQDQLDSARSAYHQQSLAVTQRQQAILDHPHRLQQLESQLQRAQSLLDAVLLDLERTKITAPFNGRVARLHVSPGNRVREGEPLLDIYSMERLEVRSQIPNKVLAGLRHNNGKIDINARAHIDGYELELKLDRIAAEVEAGLAGVDAFFRFSQNDYLPEPGRSLKIAVKLPAIENTIALPPMALYGLDKVYRLKESRLEKVDVERVGDAKDEAGKPLILVRSPLLVEGDKIVITQLPNAITGLKVQELSPEEPAEAVNE